MRERENINDVAALGVDLIGFIYYPKSPRYVGEVVVPTPSGIGRVGVFVNESEERIVEIANQAGLTHIQLHGTESTEMCDNLRNRGYKIIKALSIGAASDFERASLYDGHVDMLLFDTKCVGYGGSGEQFDWSLLDSYRGATPFMLSGGIGSESAAAIQTLHHPMFVGVDLNSRFEVAPAMKDITKLKTFITNLR